MNDYQMFFGALGESPCLRDAVVRFEAEFGPDVARARVKKPSGSSGGRWDAETLFENERWRVSVIAIAAGQTIPLHDHPGSHGAHLVLSGEAAHHQFSVSGQRGAHWVLTREQDADGRLSKGKVTDFQSGRGNAHSFTAGGEGCVLLCISRRSSDPGYWYCPLNGIESRTLIAVRLKRKVHQKAR